MSGPKPSYKERSGVDAVGGMIIETFEYFGEDVFPDKPPYLAASKAQMVYVGIDSIKIMSK